MPKTSTIHDLVQSAFATRKPAQKSKRIAASSHEVLSAEGDRLSTNSSLGDSLDVSVSPRASFKKGEHFSGLSQLPTDVLSNIASFLPLKDITDLRAVSHRLSAAVEPVVSVEHSGLVFLRFGRTNRGTSYATPPAKSLLRWTCGYCSTMNPFGPTTCRECGGGNVNCVGLRRVFVGQLRKERTAELLDWILASIFPEVRPFHIENHTSSKLQRGKGCAWVYVKSEEDEAKVLSLNKRLFVDIDNAGYEGVWFATSEKAMAEVEQMAELRGYKHQRPTVLPRQRIVCEQPLGSKVLPSIRQHPTLPNLSPSCTRTRTERFFCPQGALVLHGGAAYRYDPYMAQVIPQRNIPGPNYSHQWCGPQYYY
jgi:hypothetical protein